MLGFCYVMDKKKVTREMSRMLFQERAVILCSPLPMLVTFRQDALPAASLCLSISVG